MFVCFLSVCLGAHINGVAFHWYDIPYPCMDLEWASASLYFSRNPPDMQLSDARRGKRRLLENRRLGFSEVSSISASASELYPQLLEDESGCFVDEEDDPHNLNQDDDESRSCGSGLAKYRGGS